MNAADWVLPLVVVCDQFDHRVAPLPPVPPMLLFFLHDDLMRYAVDLRDRGDLSMLTQQPTWWRSLNVDRKFTACGELLSVVPRLKKLIAFHSTPIEELIWARQNTLRSLSFLGFPLESVYIGPLLSKCAFTCRRLTALSICSCAGLSSVQLLLLAELPLLVKLELDMCKRVSSVASLEHCARLHTCIVSWCPVDDVSPFANCKELKTLVLQHTSVSTLKPLRDAVSIKRLVVSGFTFVSEHSLTLPPLVKHLQLHRLAVTSAEELRHVAWGSVTSLDLSRSDIYDASLQCIAESTHISQLRVINLNSCDSITSLAPLSCCQSLTSLSADNSGVRLETIPPLKNLKHLFVNGVRNGAKIVNLAGCPALRTLEMGRLQFDATGWSFALLPEVQTLDLRWNYLQGIGNLLRHCNALTSLHLAEAAVNDVRVIAELPSLKEINLSRCTNIRDFSVLAASPRLQSLNANLTKVTSAQVQALAVIPTLKHLSLASTSVADDVDWSAFTALESLDVSSTGFGNQSAATLAKANNIVRLTALGCSALDGTLDCLRHCPSLRHVVPASLAPFVASSPYPDVI